MKRRTLLSTLGSVPALAWLTLASDDVPMTGFNRLRVGAPLSGITPNYYGALNVRSPDPGIAIQTAAESTYAGIFWYNKLGERMVQLVTDEPDQELSMYVKADAKGSGNTQPKKALDVQFGTADAFVAWKNFESFQLTGQSTPGRDGSISLQLHAGNEDAYTQLSFFDSTDTRQWSLEADTGDDGVLHLWDHVADDVTVAFAPDGGGIDVSGTPVLGLREITDPSPGDLRSQEWAWDATDDRWLYRDSGGTVHYFTPDGTL
ncbi:hypothetical protein [Halomarina ordinaria]|uniref:S9 family peptidase n=1 Tax=Halomarina ordinaria TaxID=3033939 RepID=A0ABD5U7G3_9EURY|nr:hypothetical protein [Halomarina sp. PSRA2]